MVLHWIENRSHVGFQSWARLRPHVWTWSTTAGGDTRAEHALEDALSAGEVVGYQGGQAVPRQYWFGKSVQDESDVFFQRSEITKAWPPRNVEPRLALTLVEVEGTKQPKGARRPTKVECLAAWLRETFPTRSARTNDELMRLAKQDSGVGRFEKRTFEYAIQKAYPKQ